MYGEKFCEVCGEKLPRWGRYDQRTCGPTCRKKLSRRAGAVAKAASNGIECIRELQEKLAWKGHESDVTKALELMRDLINDSLQPSVTAPGSQLVQD